MIKKIEAWFRAVIAQELLAVHSSVHSIEVSLDAERRVLFQHADAIRRVLEEEAVHLLQEFKKDIATEAALILAEKNKLIAELHEKVAALEETTHKIAHWKADSSTVASDDSLKLVK